MSVPPGPARGPAPRGRGRWHECTPVAPRPQGPGVMETTDIRDISEITPPNSRVRSRPKRLFPPEQSPSRQTTPASPGGRKRPGRPPALRCRAHRNRAGATGANSPPARPENSPGDDQTPGPDFATGTVFLQGKRTEILEGFRRPRVQGAVSKGRPQRSVSFNSMRRFCASASGESPSAMGRNSPNPAAARRLGGNPRCSVM